MLYTKIKMVDYRKLAFTLMGFSLDLKERLNSNMGLAKLSDGGPLRWLFRITILTMFQERQYFKLSPSKEVIDY